MRPVATLQVAMANSVAQPESTKYLNLNALTRVIVVWDHILKASTSEDCCEPCPSTEESFEQFLAQKYVQRRAWKN